MLNRWYNNTKYFILKTSAQRSLLKVSFVFHDAAIHVLLVALGMGVKRPKFELT